MKHCLFPLLGMLLAGDDAEIAKQDLAKFQGTWKLVSAVRDGKPMAAEEVKKITLTIDANKFILRKDAQILSMGSFTLAAGKKPKEIDETLTAGPNKGKVFRAIYEIDDQQHKICFAAPGQERPKSFSSEPGSGHLFQVWRREK